MDGQSVVIADDQGFVLRGFGDLTVGDDVSGDHLVGDLPAGEIGVLQAQQPLDRRDGNPVVIQLRRIDVDPHRRIGRAADAHLAHALDLRELLLHDGGRGVVHVLFVVLVGGEADDHDGRIGRIHLAIAGIGRQVGGQVSSSRVDAGFDVARGGVDIAAQVELQGHVGAAQRARRGHFGDAGDVAELALQGSGHGRGHDLRAGSGQPGRDGNGGEVHLGQRRYGQHVERDATGDGDGRRQQGCGHRPPNKWGGKVHAWPVGSGSGPPAGRRELEKRCDRLSKKM